MDWRFFIVAALGGLNLLSAVLMEMQLEKYYRPELLLLFLGIGLFAIVLSALMKNELWAWPATTVFFAALLGNLVFLFLQTRVFTLFVVTLVLTVVGLVLSVLSIPDLAFEPTPVVETYGQAAAEYTASQPKRGRKRKTE